MIRKVLPNWFVKLCYLKASLCFGEAVTCEGMIGRVANMDVLLRKFEQWEIEYSRRGYRTIPLNDLADIGGYGASMEGIRGYYGVKRDMGEKPNLYSAMYREEFLQEPKFSQ